MSCGVAGLFPLISTFSPSARKTLAGAWLSYGPGFPARSTSGWLADAFQFCFILLIDSLSEAFSGGSSCHDRHDLYQFIFSLIVQVRFGSFTYCFQLFSSLFGPSHAWLSIGSGAQLFLGKGFCSFGCNFGWWGREFWGLTRVLIGWFGIFGDIGGTFFYWHWHTPPMLHT